MRSYLKGVQALCDLFHMYEKFKKKKKQQKKPAVCLHFHTFGCIFL